MNKVPNRAKVRREYLLKKGIAYSRLILTIGMLMLCCNAVCYFVLRLSHQGSLLKLVTCVAVLGLLSASFFKTLLRAKSELKQVVSIPYVPPVHEQVAALPAEEVLLRGSQVSTASPDELLRPAGSEETKAVDLLRAASVGK